MEAPAGGRCLVCERELGAEPHMITSIPHGEHLTCRDWTRHPWPHARLVRQLRRRYRAMQRALIKVEAFGRWLEQRRRLWPKGAAETVIEVEHRGRALRATLERAGARTGT